MHSSSPCKASVWRTIFTGSGGIHASVRFAPDNTIIVQPWEENNLTDIVTLPQPHTISGNNDDGFIVIIWNDGYD